MTITHQEIMHYTMGELRCISDLDNVYTGTSCVQLFSLATRNSLNIQSRKYADSADLSLIGKESIWRDP